MINRILQNFYTPIYIEPGTYSCKIGLKHKENFHFREIEYLNKQDSFIENGVISNYENAKDFFSRELQKLAKLARISRAIGFIAHVTTHSKITDVELSALEDSLKENNCRIIKFYNEAIVGIEESSLNSSAIGLNFGYTTTEIVFIENMSVKTIESKDFGTKNLVWEISKYIEQKYNSKVSEKTLVNTIKSIDFKSKKPVEFLVKDVLKSKSIRLKIQANEFYPIIKSVIDELAKSVSEFLEKLSIEEMERIEENGIVLTGGLFRNSSYLSYISGCIDLNIRYIEPEMQMQNFLEIAGIHRLEFKKDII